MSGFEGIIEYQRNLGLRGVLAMSAYRLTGWPAEIQAHAAGLDHPVNLRLGTTDAAAFADILHRGYYDIDLPFEPKTIVDAGANIGMASLHFARRYPGAQIYAIEAEASNFAMLVRNTAAYATITPIHAALWNRTGEISIGDPDASTGEAAGKTAFVVRDGAGARVRAITIDSLMHVKGITSIDILKIDIEGAEKEVFEAGGWIRDVRSVMVELHDRFRPGCTEAVNGRMEGFRSFERAETTFYVREAVPAEGSLAMQIA